MASNLERAYFQEIWAQTQKMIEALRYSFERAKFASQFRENQTIELTPEQAEILEALTARFARLADITIQKLFRAIDALEFVDEGSLIDRLNRMEKRNIIANAEEWIVIRKLRNQIAHDYVIGDLIQLQRDIFSKCEVLFETMELMTHYAYKQRWL
jgi:hypothetical protein